MGIFTKTFLSLSPPVFSIGVFASDADARSYYPMIFDMDNFHGKAAKLFFKVTNSQGFLQVLTN